MPLATIEGAIEDIREGRMVILMDDKNRENEGDLCMAAEKVTPEAINFMARYGRGLICLSLTEERVEQLGLSMMVPESASPLSTAFTVSIDAARGITTGISATDRARTVLTAIADDAVPDDLVSPGHVFPLRARRGGVLVRPGQTEGSVDLAMLADLRPAAVICEVMNDDGTMARLPDLEIFSAKHGIKIVTIADLIEYRLRCNCLVYPVGTIPVARPFGRDRRQGESAGGYKLAEIMGASRSVKKIGGPALIHVISSDGRGYNPGSEIEQPSLAPFQILAGRPGTDGASFPTYAEVFVQTLIRLAKENPKVVGITPLAEGGGTIKKGSRQMPDHRQGLGIAEQHAVSFAAALAREGWIPVVTMSSTFLQRAYDRILHDVCLKNLHAVFAVEQGGGGENPGLADDGAFDFSYMRSIPNVVVMAPKDENELRAMVKTAVEYPGPVAFRYPAGSCPGAALDEEIRSLPIGKAELLREGKDLVVVAIGRTALPALGAASKLAHMGIDACVVNARFVKPLDRDLLVDLCARVPRVITVEDHVLQAGFGSAVLELLADEGLTGVRVKRLRVPDSSSADRAPDQQRAPWSVMEESTVQCALRMIEEGKRRREG